jgi:hypothetical protein
MFGIPLLDLVIIAGSIGSIVISLIAMGLSIEANRIIDGYLEKR